jgi:undecaprenyl-diphosphatase
MEILKILILSIVQGVTELLPISSTGHLILIGRFLEIPTSTLLLSVLHIGTTIAVILFFRKDLFRKFFTKEKFYFYLKIAVSSIPAGLAGFLLENIVDEKLHASWIIAVSLIFWGIVMIFMERNRKEEAEVGIEKVSWKQSLVMGIGQAFALILVLQDQGYQQ